MRRNAKRTNAPEIIISELKNVVGTANEKQTKR